MVDKKRKSKKGKSKKGLKQKQKQKQQVTVNVSSGGGGGGFIPAPQAPTFDYSLLANLIRPAATVDVPLAIQQMAPAMSARAAEAPSLESSIGTQTGPMRKAPPTPEPESFKLSKFTQPMRERIAESGADITLEKRESFKSGGGVFGGGIFGGGGPERRATKKKIIRDETEELYNPEVPSAFI